MVAFLYCFRVDHFKENVKAVPFLLKTTIMFLKPSLSVDFYSGEERKESHDSIMEEKKIIRHTSNRALGGQDNPQVPTSSRAVNLPGEPSHFNYHH